MAASLDGLSLKKPTLLNNRYMEKRKNTKDLYNVYAKKATMLEHYQMCVCYLNPHGRRSVYDIVELILREKYSLSWQTKIIRRALSSVRGERNATITIKEFNFSENITDILANYVKRNFLKMVGTFKQSGRYPLFFRQLVENYS